jgi:large subunit ribosomal protein L21
VATEKRPPQGHNLLIIKQMYAIVEIQGQQFKVEEGKKLFVHHIPEVESGKTLEYEKVLLIDADGAVKVGTPTVSGAKVVVEVISPIVKGEKVLVFHKKRRKGHRKLNGHRQQFTEVSIKQIVA